MLSYLRLAALAGLLVLAGVLPFAPAQGTGKVRVVIIDGQNNHNWRATTPFMKQALEQSGRFSVDVSSHLKAGDQSGTVATVPFPPDLDRYDVVTLFTK